MLCINNGSSSQKPTRKLAARTFIQSQYLKALAASLRVGFCDEWKREALNPQLYQLQTVIPRFRIHVLFFSFCSAKGRHFHCGDFEAMGRHFCEVLMDYTRARPKGCRYGYNMSSICTIFLFIPRMPSHQPS